MSGTVADQLGTGASFGRTRTGVSARRQAVAATAGAPTAGAPDARLRTLPLEHLVPTRFNPRRNFGTEEDLREFGLKLQKKQLQPAVAVTRAAYLALWEDEENNLGSAQYVIANGERRYRGSLAAGLTTLEVVVDDDIAKSRADFLDAILSENNDREDLDPIERALGIETMVAELGGADKVAEHYNKSKPWVSNQRKLLKLTLELQQLISSGEMSVRIGRDIAGLPHAEQATAWQAELARRAEVQAMPRSRKPKKDTAAPPDDARFTAVNQQQPTDPPAQQATESIAPQPTEANQQRFTAVNRQRTPEADLPEQPQPPRLPYDDGSFLARHLGRKMEDGPYFTMLQLLLDQARHKDAQAFQNLLDHALVQQENTDSSTG
ncbi:ParB/RepB/Spo0J family partition protein [Streptomyces sp. NPDC059009]|uniref:ParB/RepB/Spo0J family partition protein n=1 Tax=Streptomyces sp. NPDC059009 TaxID=3346694 RepID=UPI0036D0CEEF